MKNNAENIKVIKFYPMLLFKFEKKKNNKKLKILKKKIRKIHALDYIIIVRVCLIRSLV